MSYDYVDTIRKLIAKAESTTSSEEADAFMQKVRQLMERHGVSLVGLSTHLSDDPVAIGDPDIGYWKSDSWMRALAAAVGRYYGVRVYFYPVSHIRHEVVINGRESCRATYTLMMPYLVRAVKRIAHQATEQGLYASKSRARRDVGNALSQRLNYLAAEARQRAEAAGPRTQTGLNALVPADVLDVVEQDFFGRKPPARGGKNMVSPVGRVLAEEISLAEQVGAEIVPKERFLA